MRLRTTEAGMILNVIAGTSAILFSIDLPEAETAGLLGFYIHKKNIKQGYAYDVTSIRYFEETVKTPVSGAKYSTRDHPWQSFLWEDFYVDFKSEYEYTFTTVYGAPAQLSYGKKISIRLTVPGPKDDIHEVYFNRGVAGSQAYALKFNNQRPDEMSPAKKKSALKWLSKGLEEAMLRFIAQAKNETFTLRCCFYEFEYEHILSALKKAAAGGADVKIIYDARMRKSKNEEAIRKAKLPKRLLIPRSSNPAYIQHNKFMILLKGDKPVSVWTGSTNITEKGIFGQCNTGHIVRDKKVAGKYLAYWASLKGDPDNAESRLGSERIQPDADVFENGTTVFFSPRAKIRILGSYSNLIVNSGQLVCGMFPFSFNKGIKGAITADTDYLKYIIIDKKTKHTTLTSNDFDNVIIYGTVLNTPVYKWLDETHAGLLFRSGTNYIHNKLILIDPLSEHPIVVSGSANFSDRSILQNDENTLVIKGNTNVADLYFTEFARIFNHYSSRSDIKKLTRVNEDKHHNPNHLWTDPKDWVPSFYKPSGLKAKRRKMFSDMVAVVV